MFNRGFAFVLRCREHASGGEGGVPHRAREAAVGRREEADGEAARTCARGTPDAVHVVLGRARHVVINDHLDVLDICAQRQVGATQHSAREGGGARRTGVQPVRALPLVCWAGGVHAVCVAAAAAPTRLCPVTRPSLALAVWAPAPKKI